jgi:hypothetical protein
MADIARSVYSSAPLDVLRLARENTCKFHDAMDSVRLSNLAAYIYENAQTLP